MATSRETVRDALVTLLEAALVGVGLPCKTVSGSKVTSLVGVTPLVTVLSAATERVTLSSKPPVTFHLTIATWVLQSGTGWTLAQAEDALDSIEAIIAQTIEDNVNTANWELLKYAAPSKVEDVKEGDVPYYLETTMVQAILSKN